MADNRPDNHDIRRDAAQFFADTNSGEISADGDLRLKEWLAADPRHAMAFAQAEAVWKQLDETSLSTQNPGLSTQNPGAPLPNLREPARSSPFRPVGGVSRGRVRRWASGAVAASLVAVMLVATDVPIWLQSDAMTGTGEQSEVILPDGSIATLNTDSAIAYSDDGRTVELLKGEAAFDVASDPENPFSVVADQGATTALGTKFVVRKMGDETRVVVTEHSVKIALSSSLMRSSSAVLEEGEGAIYGSGSVRKLDRRVLGNVDAWTRGRISFVNRPLGEVVAELARYHSGYIAVSDGPLAQRPVSGTFQTDDPIGAIDDIQRTLGISSTRLAGMVILLHN